MPTNLIKKIEALFKKRLDYPDLRLVHDTDNDLFNVFQSSDSDEINAVLAIEDMQPTPAHKWKQESGGMLSKKSDDAERILAAMQRAHEKFHKVPSYTGRIVVFITHDPDLGHKEFADELRPALSGERIAPIYEEIQRELVSIDRWVLIEPRNGMIIKDTWSHPKKS